MNRLITLPHLAAGTDLAFLALRLGVGAFLVWGVWDNITSAEHMATFVKFLDQFGFPMPESMTIRATFADAVHAAGSVTPEALASYVKERVVVAHVELAATRTIFPKARIKGGAADRVYRFDIVGGGPETLLVIRDVTPPPVVQGLSEAERWRRAGMTPDGKPLNEKQLQ